METYLESIHQEAVTAAKRMFRFESTLVDVLQRVNEYKVYQAKGYTSLFAYAVGALGIPEERVYYLNVVAKKCTQVPELKIALDSGILNVSRARRIVSVIEPATSAAWIEKAVQLSQRELEKEVAKHAPQEAKPERTRILNEKDASLSLSVSIETEEGLKRLKDLLSQKQGRPVSLRERLRPLPGWR